MYYRLRQVDLDGTAAYSPVRAATELAPGVYLLRVQQGSHQQSLKLVWE